MSVEFVIYRKEDIDHINSDLYPLEIDKHSNVHRKIEGLLYNAKTGEHSLHVAFNNEKLIAIIALNTIQNPKDKAVMFVEYIYIIPSYRDKRCLENNISFLDLILEYIHKVGFFMQHNIAINEILLIPISDKVRKKYHHYGFREISGKHKKFEDHMVLIL